jgi:hypothetical protein
VSPKAFGSTPQILKSFSSRDCIIREKEFSMKLEQMVQSIVNVKPHFTRSNGRQWKRDMCIGIKGKLTIP